MWRLLLRAGISIGLIAVLLLRQNFASLIREAARIDFGGLLIGAGILLTLTAVLALRWSAILEALGSPLRLRVALSLIFIGQFFSQVLPSGIGGDIARAWLARDQGIRLGVAISSVTIDRLSGLVPLLVLATAELPKLFNAAPLGSGVTEGSVLLLSAAYCGVAVILLLDRIPLALDRFNFVRGARQIAVGARAALLSSPSCFRVLGYSFLNQIGVVLVVFILAKALDIPATMPTCLLVVPLANLLQALPISIAGWGVREGAFVAGFSLFGIQPGHALLLSVVFGVTVLITSLPGSILWLRQKPTTNHTPSPALQAIVKTPN